MADISKVKLPNGTAYDIKDSNAMPISGGTFTGPVTFGDSMTAPDANVGDLVVTGAASFANNAQFNTINGVTVGSSPKFTDTNYYHTTGSWSGLTYTATANGGAGALALTLPTGTTSTTVAAGNHTHTASLAVDTGTSTVTLAHGGKYKLTAGGSSIIFTMPGSGDTNTWRNIQVNGTEKLGTGTGTGALNIKNGNGITVSYDSGVVVAHSNSVTAQTTQAVYPIKIDAQGHISAYGSAQTILSLGTGSSNAYRGDYGNTAYTHATDSSRLTTATASGLYKVASTAQGHIASLTAVTKADITALGIPGSDTNNYVSQSSSTTDSWRKVLLHYTADSTSTSAVSSVTNVVYGAVGISVQPSSGTLRATKYNVADAVTLQYNSTTQALDFVFA